MVFKNILLLIESTQKKQEAQKVSKGCCLFIIFYFKTIGPNGIKLGMKVLCSLILAHMTQKFMWGIDIIRCAVYETFTF